MDLGERYYHLSRLGRDTFCASVAQATLVRTSAPENGHGRLAMGTGSGLEKVVGPENGGLTNLLAGPSFSVSDISVPTIIPLAKKLGTPFVDLITLGRTDGNDIMLEDLSVSRFQAFFRRRHGRWFVCDAGSSNGTRVDGKKLEPRTEAEVVSRTPLRFGTVKFLFHTSDSLYDVLANQSLSADLLA